MDSLTPDTVSDWRQILESTLRQHVKPSTQYPDVREYVIVDRDLNHFILMREGWHEKRRLHGPVVHAEIRDRKIWIHFDGFEDSITEELVAAGIPKDHIVLAFHPPYVREHTGYVIA